MSVNSSHQSLLGHTSEAVYYLTTLLLQLIPYSQAGGAGMHIGLARVRNWGYYSGPKVLGVPREALIDVARIYLIVVPLFLVASAIEFLAIPG